MVMNFNVDYDHFTLVQFNKTEVSHAFDQWGLHSTPEIESTMDHCYQALVSKLETLDTITFTQLS